MFSKCYGVVLGMSWCSVGNDSGMFGVIVNLFKGNEFLTLILIAIFICLIFKLKCVLDTCDMLGFVRLLQVSF